MSHELRQRIAAEAARLMLRGKHGDFMSARRQAARWFAKRKLAADELPTAAEIQQEMHALACLERSDSGEGAAEEEFSPDEKFAALRMLLEPLSRFRMNPLLHPEGDALYHSLQVFELGRAAKPYDEEFLLACLLHDVGLGIDPAHAVDAALRALEGLVTERTLFLIEHRLAASQYLQTGECPRALRKSEDFEELLLLARCNREGRQTGVPVCELDEALDYIAGLDSAWEEPP